MFAGGKTCDSGRDHQVANQIPHTEGKPGNTHRYPETHVLAIANNAPCLLLFHGDNKNCMNPPNHF